MAPPAVRLDMLKFFLERLTGFSAEGSIYDFDGNKVAESIDRAVCETLDKIADPKPLQALLSEISEAFQGDARQFKRKQAYGLFDGLQLHAGSRAATLLGEVNGTIASDYVEPPAHKRARAAAAAVEF
jgi:hypothetical protein